MLKHITAVAALFTFVAPMAYADSIEIIGPDLPPMIMPDGSGREAEIIRTTLEHCGHDVTFTIQPFTRHWSSFDAGQGDAVTTVPVGMPTAGTESDSYIAYQNGVSFLADRAAPIEDLNGLHGMNVVTFRGAESILPGLADHIAEFGDYREITDQIVHSRLLFSGRIDAVIGDGMIFAEYNRHLAESADDHGFNPSQATVFNATFAPSNYAMAFRNPAHTADFNRCFAELTADGTIQAINVKWVEQYRDTLGQEYMGY
ncbi:substrate-binding periplasmic protein [Aestuariibius sp. HNIBRBA575]|uniref:substrate-binding periplasmic protein n=1 Tax=Aestuariibius sp. HNIBRBA575 TaxID=3233343 RepID=UPI0034A2C8DC